MDSKIQEFLTGLVHGPCAGVGYVKYEKWVRTTAKQLLDDDRADRNLEAAGAYGRTLERWWNGFYDNGRVPTSEETAAMTSTQIAVIIANGSRRG